MAGTDTSDAAPMVVNRRQNRRLSDRAAGPGRTSTYAVRRQGLAERLYRCPAGRSRALPQGRAGGLTAATPAGALGPEPPSSRRSPAPLKAALAAAAGAHHVINYRDEEVATAIRKVSHLDLVVEVAIVANGQLNLDVAKARSSVAIYADDGGREFTLDVRQNMIKNLRYQFVLLYTVGDAALKAAVGCNYLALHGALPSGTTPACRCTGFRSQTRTRCTRLCAVGKVLIDVPAVD